MIDIYKNLWKVISAARPYFFSKSNGSNQNSEKKLVCVVSGSSKRLVFSGALDLGF